jgi:outer membrane receptor protein involved in Fe transport
MDARVQQHARIKGSKKNQLFHAAKAIAANRTAHSLAGGIMSSHRNRGASRAMALLCGLSASLATSLVIAQEKAPDDKLMDEVVVTGSRIARPNAESSVPVTTVSGEELFQTGSTSVGDLLNNLPALRSTFSQSNSSRFLGTTGLNLLDLRGLGTQRTLVLVNGRRHVGADILSNAVSPDTNTFPTDLVERIDVVTGGNSAVYGSDAIAGVVNFVLKKDFQGLQVRGQGGISDEGDAGEYYASVLGGMNFMDDRGNIAFNLEYAKQDAWFASDRDNLRNNQNFVAVQQDPAGQSSDGIPDRLFYDDIRFATLSNGGAFLITNSAVNTAAAPCGRDSIGTRYGCTFLFQPDGTLIPQTGERIGLAGTGQAGSFQGGNGSNNREADLLAIYPKLDRYSFNVFGHLTLSEAFEPFIEAKYVRTESMRYGGPAFFQGSTIDADRERIRFDNPFMTDQARGVLQAARVAAGITGGAPGTATGPYIDSSRIVFRKNFLDLGPRSEDATRETTRIVLGVGGQMSENWSYEVAANYGHFKEDTIVLGNLDTQHFALAMDSGRDGNGVIRCRSQFIPAAAYSIDDTVPMAEERLANDIATCVPLNPFGEGNITDEMKNYLLTDTTSVGKIKQFVATASVTGDSSGWFSLPAGAIGVAFGLEHRTEENFFEADELVSAGLTFYNALPLFDPPKFKVDEAFAEFRVPLLKELPWADELTLNLAGRFAEYNGDTGGVFAYNASLDWAPISSLRFRGGLARAVRAPSLVDLYSEQSQNFATIGQNDPCAARNVNAGSPTRAANCIAAGVPASYNYSYPSTPAILSGGNPELQEETSDSLTVGLVFQPEFLPGLFFSADYFDISIDDVITAPTALQIMNACYDSATLDNQFCGLFERWGAAGSPGSDPAGVDQYALVSGTLQQTLLNYASSVSRGIDFELGYQHSAGDAGNIKARLIYTLMLQRDEFLDPANPGTADQGLLELGDPKDAFNLNLDYENGPFTLGYEMRYLGKQVLLNFEDTYGLNGNPPQNADYADRRFYDSVLYQDIRLGYEINDSWNAYLGCDNFTDEEPPLGLTGTGEGSGIYDVRARYFYAGVKVEF